ncbi:electron transfer flavoprotein subunit alpha/FixB family protein [Brucella pseudogrignonensis]|uniref:electron transfer flavoprotein subunit alpha/FixB family protein n=1 Tax=Brucella pseudogrignonensis TaxID=419475 RepID=UPI003D971E01
MAVLVLGEVTNGQLNRDATAKAVNAVRELGDVTVLCAGVKVATAAAATAKIAGVSKVLVADDARYEHKLAEPTAALLAGLSGDFSHIAAPATPDAKNIMPRVAALLDSMIIPDVMKVIDSSTFERPVYAGNAIQRVRSRDDKKVFTLRTANFDAAEDCELAALTDALILEDPGLSLWLSDQVTASDRPELTAAVRVVSGGRGVGSKKDFELIEKLADKLGAAIGASRAAVDSGFAPNDWQVGQTGKIVAPELYVAVGISGAIQHLAGMKDSKIIVAINKDEEAPIFQIADFGLTGDLFTIMPELIEKL